jgi:hypothetical protein
VNEVTALALFPGVALVVGLAVAALILVINIYFIVEVIVRDDLTVGMKVFWLIVLLWLHFVGLLVYLIAGRSGMRRD